MKRSSLTFLLLTPMIVSTTVLCKKFHARSKIRDEIGRLNSWFASGPCIVGWELRLKSYSPIPDNRTFLSPPGQDFLIANWWDVQESGLENYQTNLRYFAALLHTARCLGLPVRDTIISKTISLRNDSPGLLPQHEGLQIDLESSSQLEFRNWRIDSDWASYELSLRDQMDSKSKARKGGF